LPPILMALIGEKPRNSIAFRRSRAARPNVLSVR
jgi:hypothetical protein